MTSDAERYRRAVASLVEAPVAQAEDERRAQGSAAAAARAEASGTERLATRARAARSTVDATVREARGLGLVSPPRGRPATSSGTSDPLDLGEQLAARTATAMQFVREAVAAVGREEVRLGEARDAWEAERLAREARRAARLARLKAERARRDRIVGALVIGALVVGTLLGVAGVLAGTAVVVLLGIGVAAVHASTRSRGVHAIESSDPPQTPPRT